jgi:phage terminase large subunit GpA-like protein
MPMSSVSQDRPPTVLHASWLRTRDVLRPPPPLSISEWADRHRVLGPSSPLPGQWRTDVAPFLREPMDCLSPDSGIERLVVMKSVQTGFTEVLLNAAAFYLTHCPSAVMIVQPNESMAKRLSRQRVESLIELCGVLRPLVAKQRAPGGNEVFLKITRTGGLLAIASAQSPSALRSLPARVVLCDEVDSYLADIGEGNPFDLAAARATTFGSLRKVAAISTPTEAGISLIERLFLETDQRRWHVPCPFCGFPQVLEWGNVRWEPGEAATARYQCCACNREIEPGQKAAMVAAGTWKPLSVCPPHVRGYHVNALVSPWVRWSELVAEYEAAQDSPERKKTFANLVLAEPWREQQEAPPEAAELAARCEAYPAEAPGPVALLTCGMDLQHDRAELEIVGWGPGYESWSLAYITIYGDPAEPHLWQEVDRVHSREFKHQSGMPLRIACACLDAGYLSDEVLAFTKDKFGRRIYGVTGLNGGWSKPIWPRKAMYNRKALPLFLISVD